MNTTLKTRKQIDELKEKLQSDEDFDRNAAYDELDALEEKLNEEYEEILNQILRKHLQLLNPPAKDWSEKPGQLLEIKFTGYGSL